MEYFFVGGYLRKVDNCYRIRMPFQFLIRDTISYFLFYDKAKKIVSAYPQDYITQLAYESISNNQSDSKIEKEANLMLAVALSKGCSLDFDRFNKILLPQNMREIVGPSKTVAIIGAFDHIEIMSKEQYEQIADKANLTDIITELKNGQDE